MSMPSGEPPEGPGQPPGEGWQQPPQDWQPPPQGYGAPTSEQIPNNLVWAILTTIFCCLPFGIVSIVFAAQVDSKRAGGDVQGAREAASKARTWAIVAAAVGGVFYLGWIALVMFGLFGIATELGTGF